MVNAGIVGSLFPAEFLTNDFTVIYVTNFYAFFHSISSHCTGFPQALENMKKS